MPAAFLVIANPPSLCSSELLQPVGIKQNDRKYQASYKNPHGMACAYRLVIELMRPPFRHDVTILPKCHPYHIFVIPRACSLH
jgi:hypothetical protein